MVKRKIECQYISFPIKMSLFFKAITKANSFAIASKLQTAKKPESR